MSSTLPLCIVGLEGVPSCTHQNPPRVHGSPTQAPKGQEVYWHRQSIWIAATGPRTTPYPRAPPGPAKTGGGGLGYTWAASEVGLRVGADETPFLGPPSPPAMGSFLAAEVMALASRRAGLRGGAACGVLRGRGLQEEQKGSPQHGGRNEEQCRRTPLGSAKAGTDCEPSRMRTKPSQNAGRKQN